MSNLRFQVGSTYYFFRNKLKDNLDRVSDWCIHMLPDHDIAEFQIVPMYCESHHKVNSDYDAKDTPPEYDGFIFRSPCGREYHNQYPYASYGQVSDRADRLIHRLSAEETPGKVQLEEFILVSAVLDDVKRSIDNMSDTDLRSTYIALRNNIKTELIKEYNVEVRLTPVFPGLGADDIAKHELINIARHADRELLTYTQYGPNLELKVEFPELYGIMHLISAEGPKDFFNVKRVNRSELSSLAQEKFDGIMHQLNSDLQEDFGDFEIKVRDVLRRANNRLYQLCRKDEKGEIE